MTFEQKIGRDRRQFVVFGEPFSNQRPAQGGTEWNGNRVNPAAVNKVVGQVVERGIFGPLSWLQATAMAPMKAPAKQPKKVAGEIGIGTLEMMSATRAAPNGERFRTAGNDDRMSVA